MKRMVLYFLLSIILSSPSMVRAQADSVDLELLELTEDIESETGESSPSNSGDLFQEAEKKKKLQASDTKNAIEELDGYEDLFPEEAKGDLKITDSKELEALDSEIQSGDLEELEDPSLLPKKNRSAEVKEFDMSKEEELDDLESLKQDLGEILFDPPKTQGKDDIPQPPPTNAPLKTGSKKVVVNDTQAPKVEIFDVGREEKELITVSKFLENKIPEKEWSEIAGATKEEKYVVVEGDWLWKISERLFGSGFYYAKIWSLNPYITNPHEITPGMTLVFDTGDEINLPSIKVGSFNEEEMKKKIKEGTGLDLSYFGEGVEVDWLKEREKLIKDGVFIQYGNDFTYEDLALLGDQDLNREYEKYTPPVPSIVIRQPDESLYDESGFDRSSKIQFSFKEGFFLNTFVTTNFVQDLGEIDASKVPGMMLGLEDIVYLSFDSKINVAPGDLYSIYSPEGKVTHKLSDRSGYRYTILGQVRIIRSLGSNKWEAKIIENSGVIQRSDRITVYTPKINRIIKTFNSRKIEAILMAAYSSKSVFTNGDVVYLDRGGADGTELGNVFEIFSFTDQNTGKRITRDPTYKIGEVTVISITDNFSTALVTQSSSEFKLGSIAISKSVEEAARDSRLKNRSQLTEVQNAEQGALEELDVELNLEDINQDLLDKADKIELTEDEIEELERQERERSIVKEHERDLRELEKLENEIESAEALLNEAKIDEDKYLEQQSLDTIEGNVKKPDPDAVESLEEIEREFGRKYLDEDLNSKENPYGLTENDMEEIDELLNEDIE